VNGLNDWQDTSSILRVCRAQVFKLWGSGELASVTIGRRRFSTNQQIDAYIQRLEAGSVGLAGGGDAA
jgi:hypothetical protein